MVILEGIILVVYPHFLFISELRVEQFVFGVLGLWHLGITVWVSLLIFENLIRMMIRSNNH